MDQQDDIKKFDFTMLTQLNRKKCYQFEEPIIQEELVRQSKEIFNKDIKVNIVGWDDQEYDWKQSKCIIIRSPWNYYQKQEEFKNWIEKVSEHCIIEHNKDIIYWNFDKIYLQQLEKKGVRIPQSFFIKKQDPRSFQQIINSCNLENQTIIVKPNINAGGTDCHRLEGEQQIEKFTEQWNHYNATKDMIIQPFLKNIYEGEISLVFFGDNYSHAIKKIPQNGEFRCQADYKGKMISYSPTNEEIQFSKDVISKLEFNPLYLRCDLIYDNQNQLCLQEIEVFEPYLYLEYSPTSTSLFVQEILKKYPMK